MASTVLPILREGRRPIGGGGIAPTVTAMATLDLSVIEATIQNHNAAGVATRGHRAAEAAISDHRVAVEAMVAPSVDEAETRDRGEKVVETRDHRVADKTMQGLRAKAPAILDLSPTVVETAPHNLTRRSTEAAITLVLIRTGKVLDFLAKLRFRRR